MNTSNSRPHAVALGFATLALALATWGPAQAGPVPYNITFAPSFQNGLTPTGTFDFDSSLAIDQQFSNFVVGWGTRQIDFTSAANAYTFRTDAGAIHTSCAGTPGLNDAFELLTHAPCVASVASLFQWQAAALGTNALFTFLANSSAPGQSAGSDVLQVQLKVSAQDLFPGGSGNDFLATPAGTAPPPGTLPEPGTWGLLGAALAAVGLSRRRR